MKAVHINLQPARSPELDTAATVARLMEIGRQIAAPVRVSEGFDRGRYVNLDFAPTDELTVWSAIRRELQRLSGFANAAIIVCQGNHGWDDYLLLHHFDPSEQLDHLEVI